jgi:hypothetical protein
VDGDVSIDLHTVEIELLCAPAMLGRLRDRRDQVTQSIYRSLCDALPDNIKADSVVCNPVQSAIGPGQDSIATHEGQPGTQQQDEGAPLEWNGLPFQSHSEVCIARALDRAEVLYFPNCKGRLGSGHMRRNVVPDFLVCYDGKWGILEVDGEPFHPPARTAYEHERARLFKDQGIRVVEHFDASRCRSAPDAVVAEFLRILRQS